MLAASDKAIVVIALLAALLAAAPAAAQPADRGQSPPPKVGELLGLLADPTVREWLERRGRNEPVDPSTAKKEDAASAHLSSRASAIREHVATVVAAIPRVPAELEQAAVRVRSEISRRGTGLLLLASFVALGFGVEFLFRKAAATTRRRIDELPVETVFDRLRSVAARFVFGAAVLAAFAAGSIGVFLAFDWPPLLGELVFGYLLAFLVLRLALVVADFLLAPGADRFRIVPVATEAARFWYWRIGAFVGWFAFGWVTVRLLGTIGVPPDVRRVVAYGLGLGLLAIALETVWRRPARPDSGTERFGRGARNASLSVAAVLLWGLWAASVMPTFWFLLVALALPAAIGVTQRALTNLARRPDAAGVDDGTRSPSAICIERGSRALLIVVAGVFLTWAWGFDHAALMAEDTLFTRIVRGVLSAIAIALVADVLWHVLRAMIDGKLADARDPGPPNTEEARRRARLRTLLPILRSVLLVVVIATAIMMALSSMGVEIGPLIAGAGVVGVAIGFGAQTLVKDVISGMFYLLDDAFRLGEYIQSGSYKGTVESFSLRSVKLRHHRGPLYTVPFGTLGAVQNMSRDWVIDKLSVGVTYDSDLEKAKKLVKRIGQDLAENPDFAPHILEPLKMQGVEQFGDFAVQLRMKMMTRPGEQFVIRRRAFAMIKKAFDENGIKFAFPTVQVAGDGDASSAAVAQRGLELVRPAPSPAGAGGA